MTNHQTAIFEEGKTHHLYLEFQVAHGTTVISGRELREHPAPQVHETIAFGEAVLRSIDNDLVPPGLTPFKQVNGSQRSAPATQEDLFIWLQGNARDEVFVRGMQWVQTLRDVAEVKRENHGFVFRDSRDLTGFIDGSANPKADARFEAALISEGPHANGSFILAQRWLHNLRAFHALPLVEQEQVIGRTKADSIEFDAAHMPPNSHVSRTDIKREGNAVKIFRRSTPTGSVTDPGLFFLAFSAELRRYKWLLESMFGQTGDGVTDHLLEFSKPLSGSFYFAPNVHHLQQIFA